MTNQEAVALATAKARGLALTPAGRVNFAELAKSLMRIDYPEGQPPVFTVPTGTGAAAVEAWVDQLARENAGWFVAPAAKAKSAPAGSTMTERAIAHNAVLTSGERRKELAAKAAGFGNPWITGNQTHQGAIENGDPALAARLKREAGR